MLILDVPITVPPNWSAEKDVAYYADRLDCYADGAKNYWEALQVPIEEDCVGLIRDINAALDYFYERDIQLCHFVPDCLSVPDKIDLLEEIASSSKYRPAEPDELQTALALCRTAEAERSRVFTQYLRAGGKFWLYPVVTAIHYCGAAAFHFENAMTTAYPNFVVPE